MPEMGSLMEKKKGIAPYHPKKKRMQQKKRSLIGTGLGKREAERLYPLPERKRENGVVVWSTGGGECGEYIGKATKRQGGEGNQQKRESYIDVAGKGGERKRKNPKNRRGGPRAAFPEEEALPAASGLKRLDEKRVQFFLGGLGDDSFHVERKHRGSHGG